ncbi:hypothetical protein [Sphingomonas crocodyli]|uniref:Uncharacterized protein n=1 Tax=Sphingomonas crocodyli TaxID=1979270 RepID=A0A437M7U6_9SPHN|nr:hypothetical protein [Sphingomonas crocodyli]RVT93729.1 hypothetical protein EOD43_07640 [Sphingomonas crocodyli]
MNALVAIDTGLPVRTLRDVALDLSGVKARLAVHYGRVGDPTDAQDADWSDLEDQKLALEAEFIAIFYVSTGMRWSHATQVMA